MATIIPYQQALLSFKRSYMVRVMEEANGHEQRAAILAKIHRNTISRVLNEAGMPAHRFRPKRRST